MHDFKCVKECPEKYLPSMAGDRCVLDGFFCPFGYEMNARGDGCLLMAQVCEAPARLSQNKEKCIPQPGLLIPCPLLILAAIGTTLIVRDKRKHPRSRFYPNMISMLSILETIGLVSLVALSEQFGIGPTHALSTCALLFLGGLNILFGLVYYYELKNDSAFKYWEQEYEKTTAWIVFLGVFGNFKFFRMFYSRYQNKKEFKAAFSDEILFYRAVMFTSTFYILTGVLPTIVASIFGLVYMPLGYQVAMFCLELLIIETTLLVLMSLELYKIRTHIIQPSYYKMKPRKGRSFNVMAGVPGEKDYSKKMPKHDSVET